MLLHIDVKKLGRIPDGGGHRVRGRATGTPRSHRGYDYLHVAIDDMSRVAYVAPFDDERGTTCAGSCATPPRSSPVTGCGSSGC